MKKSLNVPVFKNEDMEAEYWSNLDLSEYLEPTDFKPISFPNLKPTSRSVSIRFPEYLLDRLKEQANSINVPYQSLVKQFVEQGLLKKL